MAGASITAEAKARLALFHGINHPTERETALFALYGKKAPFLQDTEQAYRNVTNDSGGTFTMKKSELERVLSSIKGTSELLRLLCDEPLSPDMKNAAQKQEALFRIEELLQKDVAELEKVIYID